MRVFSALVAAAAVVAPSSTSAMAATAVGPSSPTAPCSPADVLWLWKGALAADSVVFKFGLRPGHRCRDRSFVLHATPERPRGDGADTDDPRALSSRSTLGMCHGPAGDESATVKSCELHHLPLPNTRYRYELTVVGSHSRGAASTKNAIARAGTFTTPPPVGTAFDFRFTFASCADEDSDPEVFRSMARAAPLFFLHMGDLHYSDIAVNDVGRFRRGYHELFASPSGQAMLAMDVPFAYMWDDHDFGPDNSDRSAPGRVASLQVYREMVPHYELPGDVPDDDDPETEELEGRVKPRSKHREGLKGLGAVYQAFTIGRVRFLLTDLRSEQMPDSQPDVPSKTALGVKQKKWFKEELVHATQDPNIGLIVWCSTMPWNDDERKWGRFQHEQRELVNYMRGHGVNRWKPLVIVSGDAHMLAVDDGQHTPGNLTLFHAAALGRPGSIKGGPYSHGVLPGTGQYGIMDVRDDGKRVCLVFQGVRISEGVLLEYDTCHPERTPPNSTFYPPPIFVRKLQRATKKLRRQFVQILVAMSAVFVLVATVWNYARPQAAQREKKDS